MSFVNVMPILRATRLFGTPVQLFNRSRWPVSGKCRQLTALSCSQRDRRNCCYNISREFACVSRTRTRSRPTERPVPFVFSVFRHLSSDKTRTDEDPEVNADIIWDHPAVRTEDAVAKDPELRSLLCEIASDFGRPQAHADNDTAEPQKSVTEDPEAPTDKITPVENITEDTQTITTATGEEEDFGRNVKDEGDLSPVKTTRKASEVPFVFSIDDIVDILREENARDICVISVPPEKNYVDYFVVVTGRSTRHLSAMTQYINKLYKQRKCKTDPFLTVEGKVTDDWMCLDFGNIVVHFMLEETRALYDLEKLWVLGKEFDDHMEQWNQQEVLLFNPEMDLQRYVTGEGVEEDTGER